MAFTPLVLPPSAFGRCFPLVDLSQRALSASFEPAAERLAVGCPLAEPPGRPKVTVRVLKWCNLPGPHKQILFKLKVSIRNGGQQTLNIGVPHWRLLVSHFTQGRWTPPPSRYATGRPVVVRWAGRSWWAIPANPDGAAEPDPFQPPGTLTFATHWDGLYLRPGQTYIRRERYKGDLVFYVPTNDRQRPYANLRGDIALAYFAGRRPTVVVPSEQWGPRRPGAEF
jgi:hypothetical protein